MSMVNPGNQVASLHNRITLLLHECDGRPVEVQDLPLLWMKQFQVPLDVRQQYGVSDIITALRMQPVGELQRWVLQKGSLYLKSSAPISLKHIAATGKHYRIRALNEKKFVGYGNILHAILEKYNVDAVEDLGFGGPSDIPCLRRALDNEHAVSDALMWFQETRNVATLPELEAYVQDHLGHPYKTLQMGELAAHPKVHTMLGLKTDVLLDVTVASKVELRQVLLAVVRLVERCKACNAPINVSTEDVVQELHVAFGYPHNVGVAIISKDPAKWGQEVYYRFLRECEEAGKNSSATITQLVADAGKAWHKQPSQSQDHKGKRKKHWKGFKPWPEELSDEEDMEEAEEKAKEKQPEPSLPGVGYEIPSEGTQVHNQLTKKRWANHLNLPETFTYSEMFAHFRTTVKLLCLKSDLPEFCKPGAKAKTTKLRMMRDFSPPSFDAGRLAGRIFMKYTGGVLWSPNPKLSDQGARYWRSEITLHMLLHMLWQYCHADGVDPTALGPDPVPAKDNRAAEKMSQQPGGSDVIVIDSSEDDQGRHAVEGSKDVPQTRSSQQDKVGRVCAAIRALNKAIKACKPSAGVLWNAAYTKKLRGRVRSNLGYNQEKLQALSVILGFILQDNFSGQGLQVVPGPAGAEGEPANKSEQARALYKAQLGRERGEEGKTGRKRQREIGGEEQGTKQLVSEQELVEMVRWYQQGATLSALHTLEHQLLEHYSASQFSDLGQGPSLLAFLDSHADLLQDLGADRPAFRPLPHVLDMAAQAVAAVEGSGRGSLSDGPEKAAEGVLERENAVRKAGATPTPDRTDAAAAVSWSLTRHFSVQCVEQLGYGPAQKLVKLTQEAGVKPTSTLRALHPLLYLHDSGNNPISTAFSLLASSNALSSLEQATRSLISAPDLTDLAEWTGWEEIFSQKLGPLDQFLKLEGARLGVAALQLPGGQLLKVPAHTEVDTFVSAVLRDDPHGAAVAVVSLVLQSGGLIHSPLALLQSSMEHCMATLAVQSGHSDDGAPPDVVSCASSYSSRHCLCCFSLHFLDALPRQLRPALAPPLVLQPLAKLLGGPAAVHKALLDGCDNMHSKHNLDLSRPALSSAAQDASGAAAHLDSSAGEKAVNRRGSDKVDSMDTALGNTFGDTREQGSSLREAREQASSLGQQSADRDSLQLHGGTAMRPATQSSRPDYTPCNYWHNVLHHLGVACGVMLWQEHMLQCWQGASQQSQGECTEAGAHVETNRPTAAGGADVTRQEREPESCKEVEGLPDGAARSGPLTQGLMEAREEANNPLQVLLARVTAEAVGGTQSGPADSQAGQAPAESVAGPAPASPAPANPAAGSTVADSAITPSHPNSTAVTVVATAGDAPNSEDAAGLQSAQGCGADGPQLAAGRELVEQIRRDEFGIGMDLPQGPLKDLRERQNARMGRALQRLSHELYSSDTHFVLELVQNADDNAYPDGCVPTLEFTLCPDSIHVSNNERGFSPANLCALCDVGASTKANSSGYIGHKGIGFKSVFRVTDTPHIYSNGFQVMFDLTVNQSLGYILPTWLERQVPVGVSSRVGLDAPATRVVLPIRPRHQGEEGEALRAQFRDLHPTLLLFLQRLQCIAVQDAASRSCNIMIRRQLSPHVIELCHGQHAQHTSRWLIISSSLHPTVPRCGSAISETRVALAFELDTKVPKQQAVFAFLPLRSYGLKFVVQGDFVVPSSRESVDRDSAWNQMLRAELGPLYVRALHVFLTLPPPLSRPHYWVDRWLSCIPVDGEAQGFFAPLPHSIAARVRTTPCIPTETGEMVCPCQAMVCDSPAIQGLVSGPLLREALNAHIVHPDLQVLYTSPALRSLLGVAEFSPAQIVQLLRAVNSRHQISDLGPEWVAGILISLVDAMEAGASTGVVRHRGRIANTGEVNAAEAITATQGQGNHGARDFRGGIAGSAAVRAEIWRQMQALELLPLEDGTYVAPKAVLDAGSSIFLPLYNPNPTPVPLPSSVPLPRDRQPKDNASAQLLHWMEACYIDSSNLRTKFVSLRLFDSVKDSPERLSLLVTALKALNVRDLCAEDVFFFHILDMFKYPEAATPLQPKQVAGLLAFPLLTGLLQERPVPSGQHAQQRILSVITTHALVVTNLGVVNPFSHSLGLPLHLPPLLCNNVDLVKVFPSVQWLVVDECYAREFPTLLLTWRWLFTTAFKAADWLHYEHVSALMPPGGEPVGCHTYESLLALYRREGERAIDSDARERTAERERGESARSAAGTVTAAKIGAIENGKGSSGGKARTITQPNGGDAAGGFHSTDGEIVCIDMDEDEAPVLAQGAGGSGVSTAGGNRKSISADNAAKDAANLEVIFEVQDWQCASLSRILKGVMEAKGSAGVMKGNTQGDAEVDHMQRVGWLVELVNVMAAHWEEVEPKLQARWRVAGSGEAGWKLLPSSFCYYLRESAWLPSSHGLPSAPQSLVQPSILMKQLLGDNANYLHPHCLAPNAMLRTLRVAVECSVDLLLQHLKRWSESETDGKMLTATMQQMGYLYGYLARESESNIESFKQVHSVFSIIPVIWLPIHDHDNTTHPCVPQPGTLQPCSNCRYSDPAKVFQGLPPLALFPNRKKEKKTAHMPFPKLHILEDYYPQLVGFFCRLPEWEPASDLHPLVKASPSLQEYCAALRAIAGEGASNQDCTLLQVQNALKVFAYWERQHAQGALRGEDVEFIRSYLANHAVLPTTVGTWATAMQGVLIPDADEALLPMSVHSSLAEQGVFLLQLESYAEPAQTSNTSSGANAYATTKATPSKAWASSCWSVATGAGANRALSASHPLPGSSQPESEGCKEKLQALFAQLLHIPTVSSVIQRNVNASGASDFKTETRVQKMLQSVIPLAQKYVYHNLEKPSYDAFASAVAPVLEKLRCRTVEQLDINMVISLKKGQGVAGNMSPWSVERKVSGQLPFEHADAPQVSPQGESSAMKKNASGSGNFGRGNSPLLAHSTAGGNPPVGLNPSKLSHTSLSTSPPGAEGMNLSIACPATGAQIAAATGPLPGFASHSRQISHSSPEGPHSILKQPQPMAYSAHLPTPLQSTTTAPGIGREPLPPSATPSLPPTGLPTTNPSFRVSLPGSHAHPGAHATYSIPSPKVVLDGNELLVLHSASRMFHLIAAEVARMFRPVMGTSGLEELLYLCMLGCEAGEDVELLAERRGLGRLSMEVPLWKVPNPSVPPPVQPPPPCASPSPMPPPAGPPPALSSWGYPLIRLNPASPPVPPTDQLPTNPSLSHRPLPKHPQPLDHPPTFIPTAHAAKRLYPSGLHPEDSASYAKRLRSTSPSPKTPFPPSFLPPGQVSATSHEDPFPPSGETSMWGRMTWDPTQPLSKAPKFASSPPVPGLLGLHPQGFPPQPIGGQAPAPLAPRGYSGIAPPTYSSHPAGLPPSERPSWAERQAAAKAAGNIAELSLAQVASQLSRQPITLQPQGGPSHGHRSGLSSIDLHNIGRYGEEMVWNQLERDPNLRPAGFDVRWLNQTQEAGEPYDLVIKDPNGQQVYVEVKTSSSSHKQSFEISYREVCFAQLQGDAYHIYRILGAGSANPTLVRLVNPIKLWVTGSISMHLVM